MLAKFGDWNRACAVRSVAAGSVRSGLYFVCGLCLLDFIVCDLDLWVVLREEEDQQIVGKQSLLLSRGCC